MDNTSGQVQGADADGGSQFQKFNLHSDYAPCDFDVASTANISLVYDLPRTTSFSGAGRVLNGWRLTTILAARSALPFTVLSGRDNSFTGAPLNDFADQLSRDTTRAVAADSVLKWFNTSAFVENAINTFGNTQRNTMRGPGFWGVDIGILNDTKITERALLQFRFEGSNIMNHANFNNPVNTVTNANFGKILGAADPRVLQFALKLVL